MQTLLILHSFPQTDHPGGVKRGEPGAPVDSYIAYKDEGERPASFSEIVKEGSPYVLYGVEEEEGEAVLVFLKLKPATRRELYEKEPFIDRGLRKLVELGSTVAFCSLSTAEAQLAEASSNVEGGAWRLAFVWNCGRCGSTVMHRAMVAQGAVSLSEPHWLDQLLRASPWVGKGPAELAQVVRVCCLVETLLARRQRSPPGWTKVELFSQTVERTLSPASSSLVRLLALSCPLPSCVLPRLFTHSPPRRFPP